jgi:hypothetical protein
LIHRTNPTPWNGNVNRALYKSFIRISNKKMGALQPIRIDDGVVNNTQAATVW